MLGTGLIMNVYILII